MRTPSPGFTLPELVTCVAILGIVAAMAIPAMQRLRTWSATADAVHGLTASLASARMAAVARGGAVAVCPSSDGRSCRGDLVWDHGWLVFDDRERRGQPVDAGAVLWHATPPAGILIRATVGRQRVRFHADGMAGGNNVTLRLCNGAGAALAEVVVNLAGRARSAPAVEGTPCPFQP